MKVLFFNILFIGLPFFAFSQWTTSGSDLSTTYNNIILNSTNQSTTTLWLGQAPSSPGHYYIKAYDYWGPYVHFQATGDNGNEKMNVTVDGMVGIGTLTPSEKLDVDGKIRWGTSSTSSWGEGLLSMNSGWSSGSYPTIGSVSGTNGSLIMLHNPHVPFRTDNSASGYNGRAGLRMAINENVSSYWDMGLAGDFFHIYRTSQGEFFRITNQGNVGIGTISPTEKLVVDGKILAEEIKVQNVPSSDYVFEPDYNLRPIHEVETFVKENKHLPDIPSSEEFKEHGVGLGEMDDMLLRKVEELTLYVIELKRENEELKLKDKAKEIEIEELKAENNAFKTGLLKELETIRAQLK